MDDRALAQRLRRLPRVTALGYEVRVAEGFGARLLGLAHLDREETGGGLLIPRCSCVHTFGMRFPLDLFFIDRRGRLAGVRREVPARRVVLGRGASMVLEIPSARGERSPRRGLGRPCSPSAERSRAWSSVRTTHRHWSCSATT